MRELYEGQTGEYEGMDADEFFTWAAYLAIEPFPETRLDVQTGLLLQQTHNMNRGKGKPAKKLADFLPQWSRAPRPPLTDEQMKETLAAWYLRWGGDPKALS